MSEMALRAQHLGKQYKIGLGGPHHTTLRDHLVASARALCSA